MSLEVSQEIVKQAQDGQVKKEDFINIVRESLPFAWGVVSELAEIRNSASESGLATFGPPSLGDTERAQLLRMMAGTRIRTAVEEYFGVTLAFQNCHGMAAAILPDDQEAFERYISIEAQILNQSPEMRDC